ncbi:PhzF family phenazine biosynthesis protein [Algicola sagamiensis]|uniref:PhzF family phenazine biosynthesis protein n=1 Tax=Algicola sagamiensis TaxID=163869 RepID=UPI0003A2CA69|nr:PhzF family phenazine biosynthesis protein [Algicola sagamiensis]
MQLKFYQIDAFTSHLFHGNPAGVIPLENWLPDSLMQKIASENNLSETAFFVHEEEHYHIRWFTPEAEVNLCGHATLATAFVLHQKLGVTETTLKFMSKSGPLYVDILESGYALNFPANTLQKIDVPEHACEALGAEPVECYVADDLVCVFSTEAEIASLTPDFLKFKGLPYRGIVATAPGMQVDFVSRWFGPELSVPEDPVTGSAHCSLMPIWAEKLGKQSCHARQISQRSGDLDCTLDGDRVKIIGQAVAFMEGVITLPTSEITLQHA